MLGTFSVVKFCSDNKIKLIYSASSSKFGNKGKDENLSPYSWTKSKNIELIENYNKWFDLRYEILYFYNVYGPGQIKKSKMAAVIAIFEEQYKNKKSLTVVKPGTQKRDFTHINDIVNGCFLAFKKGKNDHYFLSSKKSYKILDIAKMFKTKIKMVPERKGERLGSFYKKSNTERHLNFKTTINIEDYIFSLINKH
jgi:UDP-glucose 4-epimerase